LVSDFMGGTETKGVLEQDAAENIWNKSMLEGELYKVS
jgi:hypothetical protein